MAGQCQGNRRKVQVSQQFAKLSQVHARCSSRYKRVVVSDFCILVS